MNEVTLHKQDGRWRMERGGQPYFIKGAGADAQHLESLARHGANSVRLSTERLEDLDRAHALGLSVELGLPVRGERDGMNYDDETAVAAQYERVMRLLRRFHDHPAVLVWELGNELEWIPPGIKPSPKVWDEVNRLAEAIHALDGRPVSTVVGGIDWSLRALMERCPALDVLGINAYANLADAPQWMHKHGWDKPYIVTEWGPSGFWQVPKTSFGLPIEETSTEKADGYRARYEQVILGDAGCLGSYVFLWRQHQEQTHTWFGMFDAEWRASEAVDVMQYEWTGAWPPKRAPRITPVTIDGRGADENIHLEGGSLHSAAFSAVDADGDTLRYHWEILPENMVFGYGGHGEKKPDPAGTVHAPLGQTVTFTAPAPDRPTAYRLFATVYDEGNHFASANIPFVVSP